MFGNRLGWGISGLLLCIAVVILYLLGKLNTVSEPSRGAITNDRKFVLDLADHPQMIEEIKLPFDPLAILPSMTKSGDAAPSYRKAIAEAERDSIAYDPESRTRSEDIAQYPAIAPLIEAKDLNAMNLFTATPEDVIVYRLYPRPIEALRGVGYRACDIALRMLVSKNPADVERDKPKALELAEASFSLGTKMCQERVRYAEFEVGYQLIMRSAAIIGRIDPARKPACDKAMKDMQQLVATRGLQLYHAFSSIDLKVMSGTAGDMFYIARNAKDRMWRIEAVLKLGHYKHNAGDPGRGANQRGARIVTRQMANDEGEDPLVRRAAKLASDLTLDEYRSIGGN